MPIVTGVEMRSMFSMFGRDLNVKVELFGGFNAEGSLSAAAYNPKKQFIGKRYRYTKGPPPLDGWPRGRVKHIGEWVHHLSIM